MEGQEYPKALYRDGGEYLIWGKPVCWTHAQSRDEEEALRRQGWRLHPIPNPLDHDGDQEDGGSVSGGSGDQMKMLRAEYRATFGKRAFPGWREEEIQRRMAEKAAMP